MFKRIPIPNRNQVAICLLVLGMAVTLSAAQSELTPEEEIEKLEHQIKDLKADIRVLDPALKRTRSQAVKKVARLMRPDSGFRADGITLGKVSYTWRSKHAGKTIQGEMKANADARATLTGRKAR